MSIKAVALTDCTISVEAAQLVRAREANYPPIGPGEKVKLYIPHFDHLLLLLPIDHHPDDHRHNLNSPPHHHHHQQSEQQDYFR